MKFIIFVMLLTAATAFASTHVNVSFTQHHSSTGSKMSDSFEQHNNNDDHNGRFARIQVEGKKADNDFENTQKVVSDGKSNHESTADYRSERVQNEGTSGYFGAQSQNQHRGFYNSNQAVHQNHGQFRNISPQEKQNMEFERYIQNYHSGPTVETVYESAKPEMQHTLTASADHEGSQRVSKFERLVAPPTKADSVQSDEIKPIINHQPVVPSNTASVNLPSSSASSSLSPSLPSVAVSSTNGKSFNVNLNQKPASVGKDGFNFDLSYNKPNYNDPSYKFNEGHSDAHFYNQFPPSVEEPQSGYGHYYGNNYGRQQVADGYHPMEQRPVVTKTIQIAQPAIKAKKYEVRHPAIQKEFYDIEERVVIKPAGTVVVELERPSAKILKEETTLPLGHPHPAVASAYMPSRNTQSFSNIIYSNSGSSSANHPNNQYIPHQTYNNNDRHSPSASSPTYDQSSKEVIAESNQNKPYHFSAAATTDGPKPQNREIVVVTDGNGNQRQISTEQLTYSRDETDNAPSRPVYNHRNSYAYEDNGRSNHSPQRSGVKANLDNRDGFTFDAEYINNSGNTNLRKENKPARLQEASSRVTEQMQPIIKHEHKIVLSPSQHNIYLSRNVEVPKMKFIEETAQVREIKPYLQNHQGRVMVYGSNKQAPEVKYVQRSEYQPQPQPQRSQSDGAENRVQYSAPYAQMRHHSDGDQYANQHEHKQHRLPQKDAANQRKSEKLIVEDKSEKDLKKTSVENTMEKEAPQAHIEIKIPNQSSHDADKAIVVNSKIRPMMMDDDSDQTHHSKLEISVANKGEPKQQQTSNDKLENSEQIDINDNKNDSDIDSEQLSNFKTKPDCDQTSVSAQSGNYEVAPEYKKYGQQKFMRIVEEASAVANDATPSAESSTVNTNNQHHNVDANVNSATGHVSPPGSRVIAATPALKESTPSESFHKRRIVVNHPFQTVREVVEHEPYTKYHEVQVNEPATPDHYHSANYFQSHGALRQSDNGHSAYYH
ncbi:uncharacterized protein LOC135955541 [Calliphora vicina]|uniref:uncharacterized protein LOC135955541 n=1 Tax=Calliphora vicina TaxID=7373 RepID=UPI00325B3E28